MIRSILVFVMLIGWTLPALADRCYICSSGSGCGQYCRYTGADNADNRKKCTTANCKIGGTASCPTGVNIKTCSAARPLDRLHHLATFAEERPQ